MGEKDFTFNFIYTAKFMQHHMSEKDESEDILTVDHIKIT